MEENRAALSAKVQSSLARQFSSPAIKRPDTVNAPGVTYNKTAWHVPSRRSNAAPTPALAKMRYQYFAYITTL